MIVKVQQGRRHENPSRVRYAESTTLKVQIMAQIHEKTVTHYKKDAHKLAGDRE